MGALGQVMAGAHRPPPPRRFAAGGTTGQPPSMMGAGTGDGPDALALMMLLNGQLPPVGGAPLQQPGQGASSGQGGPRAAAASLPLPPTPPAAPPPQQQPAGGALGTAGAGVDPSTGGALARADARAQKLAAITRAQRVLQASGAAQPAAGGTAQPAAGGTPQPVGGTVVNGVPFAPAAASPPPGGATPAPMNTQVNPALAATLNAASGGPGASNLSELAAAGAMLAPTHTGTLSESIGNAFRAAVPVAQAQRKLASDAALRLQQQQWMESYRADMMGARNRGLDIQTQRANAETPMYTARAAYFSAVAAARTAGHATSGDIEAQTIQNLMKQTNPTTGKPYTQPEAFAAFRALGQKPQAEHVQYAGTDTKTGLPILLNTTTGQLTTGALPIGMKPGEAARASLAQAELALRQQVASGKLTADQANTALHLMSADRNPVTGAPNHPLDFYIGERKTLNASAPAPAMPPMAPAAPAAAAAPAAGTEAQGTRANPWKVLLPSEAAKLPPGSWYMAPNGRMYQRSNTPGG